MKVRNNFNGKAMVAMTMGIVLLCISQITFAPDRWSFEFRPGVNFQSV